MPIVAQDLYGAAHGLASLGSGCQVGSGAATEAPHQSGMGCRSPFAGPCSGMQRGSSRQAGCADISSAYEQPLALGTARPGLPALQPAASQPSAAAHIDHFAEAVEVAAVAGAVEGLLH